jgi:hypothetical protein
VLVLLPPSEGKTRPSDGPVLDLDALSFPALTRTRQRALDALVRLSAGRPARAMEVLGLGPTQADALATNAALREEPTGRADEVYTGVLFNHLDLASLPAEARERADRTLAVASGLFGLLRPGDPIPAYRLSGSVTLPRLGTVSGLWRTQLPAVMDEAVGDGLLVDLRSGTYVNLGKPSTALAPRTATMRVLHERPDGQRKVVSHFNKATKGRLVRALLVEGAQPASVDELAAALGDLGWTVERAGNRLDVVVAEV